MEILAVGVFVLVWWWVAQRRWIGRRRSVAGGGADVVADVVDGVVADRDMVKCARGLARMWSRELLRSPAFATGIGLLIAFYLAFALLFGQEEDSWSEGLQSVPWFAHPLVGMTIIAVHRAVTRARRDDVSELIDTCPLPDGVRTVGHLGVVVAPLIAFAVFVVALVGTKIARGFAPIGPVGSQWLDLLGAFVLIVGGVALGVALGRWVPYQFAPVVAVIAVLVVTIWLSTAGDPGWNALADLSTAPPFEEVGVLFAPRADGWHVVWLLGLTGLMIAAALAWSRRDRAVGAIAIAATLLTIAGGIGSTRGVSAAEADHIVDLIVNPEAHQTCEASPSGALEVCAYDGYADFVPALMAGEPVAVAIPGSGRVVIRQGLLAAYRVQLPPEVRDRLPADVSRPANETVVGFDPSSDDDRARLALAFRAVGLPAEEPVDDVPLIVVGEARSVVALWLATAGLSDDEALELLESDTENAVGSMARSAVWAGVACWIPPAVTSIEELELARRLAVGDDTRMTEVVAARWDEWIDPATSTAELVAALGRDGPTTFTPIEPQPFDSGC